MAISSGAKRNLGTEPLSRTKPEVRIHLPPAERCYGAGGEDGNFVAYINRWSGTMPQPPATTKNHLTEKLPYKSANFRFLACCDCGQSFAGHDALSFHWPGQLACAMSIPRRTTGAHYFLCGGAGDGDLAAAKGGAAEAELGDPQGYAPDLSLREFGHRMVLRGNGRAIIPGREATR